MSDKLFSEIVEAILKQLHRVGFKIVVAHGHGPSTNYFIKNSKSLDKKFDLVIMTLWRKKEDSEPSMEFQYDHAATNETSIMMALHPNLVDVEYLPKDTKEWPIGIWGKDPRKYASATHGEKIIDIHSGRMESILREQLVKLRRE